jgi:hypothetical protein
VTHVRVAWWSADAPTPHCSTCRVDCVFYPIRYCSLHVSPCRFDGGFFWQRNLPLAHEGWEAFITLEQLLAAAASVPESHLAAVDVAALPDVLLAEPEPDHYRPAALSADPASIDGDTTAAHGSPALAGLVGAAHSLAGVSAEDETYGGAIAAGLDARRASAIALERRSGRSASPAAAASPSAADGGPALDDAWQYIDESGAVQGPFASRAMAEWTSFGYFTEDVQIRHCGGLMPEGAFLPLGALFPDPGPGATEEELDATAPFESECWRVQLTRLRAADPQAAAVPRHQSSFSSGSLAADPVAAVAAEAAQQTPGAAPELRL